MEIICGPLDDLKSTTVSFPDSSKRIGVFVSGGIDSAILYYLINLANKNQRSTREIVPLSMMRKDGSRYFAKMVIDYIHDQFELERVNPLIVGDNHLPDMSHLLSGTVQAVFDHGIDVVYLGSIQVRREHVIGVVYEGPHPETHIFKTPFRYFDKSHIIDLVYRYDQEFLFNITHSCDTYELGRCGSCNACRERLWGFERLGRTDPGKV